MLACVLLSKSQIDKLGDRLRSTAKPSAGDVVLYDEYRASHRPALAEVCETAASLFDMDLKYGTGDPEIQEQLNGLSETAKAVDDAFQLIRAMREELAWRRNRLSQAQQSALVTQIAEAIGHQELSLDRFERSTWEMLAQFDRLAATLLGGTDDEGIPD